MNTPMRILIAAAAVLLIVVVGINLLPKTADVGAPTSTPGAVTPQPSSSAAAAASPASSGLVLHIRSIFSTTTWSPDTLSAPADTPFKIALTVPDPQLTINLVIEDANHTVFFQGDPQVDVGTKVYDIPPLKAGTYFFISTIDLHLRGTLTVS